MRYFYKICRFTRLIISSVQTISNTKTLKCSIKSMESMFNLPPFGEKIENYEIYIFVSNSQNLVFIKSLTWNIESLMIWQTMHQWWYDINANSKSQSHILCTDHQLFEKLSKKSGDILHWKRRQLSEYVTKVINNLFRKALFTSLIEKWLIYHMKNQLNNFGLKIRIFDISKIKIFEKNIFTGNCSCDLKFAYVKIF